jgi:transposase-like protein
MTRDERLYRDAPDAPKVEPKCPTCGETRMVEPVYDWREDAWRCKVCCRQWRELS